MNASPISLMIKRSMDVLFSILIFLLMLSWLIPIIAFIIKLSSKGPVFFIQKRSGKDNQPFNCIKFRTMLPNEDAHTQQAIENDPRITKIGKVLRRLSLDELPQFINVIKGDMSIIGPRPHMINHTNEYSKISDNYMQRLSVRPGISGLSQVMGYRGEIKNKNMILNRVRLDVFYIRKWYIGLDIYIILKTIHLLIFSGEEKK